MNDSDFSPSAQKDEFFAEMTVKQVKPSQLRFSTTSSSPERSQHESPRLVNSMVATPSKSGQFSEISLESNVSPFDSSSNATTASAFGFIGNAESKRSDQVIRTNSISNTSPRGKNVALSTDTTLDQLSTGAFVVPNNGLPNQSFQSPSQIHPMSQHLSLNKTRRVVHKTNKVSLAELNIDTDTERSSLTSVNNGSSSIFSLLNSPPLSAKIRMENLEVELSRMEGEMHQIMDSQLKIFQKRNKIHEQLAESWGTLRLLEIEQSDALSSEDYIQADKVMHEVQETHNKIITLCRVLPGMEQALSKLRERQARNLKSQADISRSLEKELWKKKKEDEDAYKQYDADMENLRNIETKQINEMREQLERDRSEIVLELDLWNKNVADLNERMDERACDEKSERESLYKKREYIRVSCVSNSLWLSVVMAQIADLSKRIEQLRTEEESYNRKIGDVELKMEGIYNEFHVEREENSREKKELERKEREIEDKTRKVEESENNLHQRLNHYRQKQELAHSELSSLEQRIGEMVLVAKIHHEEAAEIEKLIENLRDRSQRDLDCDNVLSDLRRQIEESEGEVKRLTSKVMQDQQTYSTIQQDMTTIDTQIPALEEQKKLAVAGRDFKSAGRLAGRIKDLQSLREERVKFLESKRSSLERDQEDLKTSRQKLEELSSNLTEMEKKIGSELCEELQESLLQLRSRYDVISTAEFLIASGDPISSANQQNLNILKDLLQNEIQGLERRIQYIRMRFGLLETKIQSGHSVNELHDNAQEGSDSTTRLEELERRVQKAIGNNPGSLSVELHRKST
ncbi:16505_t:CDS:10 [Acaulospora morrowiae]|uniref:16505_t:CDS:1 n=1 Tax=Acaulospora morrowiae TaxID=94023 RepID=A0A9N9D9C1_9GLOM|nr:16505_t:CDS:10 [Acaulospora morrowiae]